MYNFVRGFGWDYNRGSFYPKGLISGIKRSFGNKLTKMKLKTLMKNVL